MFRAGKRPPPRLRPPPRGAGERRQGGGAPRSARYIPSVVRGAASEQLRPSPNREDPLNKRRATPLAVLAAVAAVGCDRSPEAVIVPEFDLSYSFEAGLEGWTVASADLGGGSVAVEPSSERASDGARAARITLSNPGGAAKVWMTRALELTPEKRYTASITFDLATPDHGASEAWKLIVGIRTVPPASTASLDFQGDTSSGLDTAQGLVWTRKRFIVPAQTDEKGRIYLSVGIWGTTAGSRAYWLDNVRVLLTRTS